MVTVRTAVHELMRAWGVNRVFGNPGSNELPFLKGLPSTIEYTLGLHEGVVVGMADGWAQVTGRTAFVNLHAAAGTGNALGALTNVQASRTPMLITAGQQVRHNVGLNVMLANERATLLPEPLVAFSGEPLCATDTPRMLTEAWHIAGATRAPAYVSIPYDDWEQQVDNSAGLLLKRSVASASGLACDDLEMLRDAALAAGVKRSLALVLGADIDTAGAFDIAVQAAEVTGARVYAAPSLCRLPFPNRHPQFVGVLPAAAGDISDTLSEFDLVLVLGAPVFRYHQDVPGSYLGESTRLIQVTTRAADACRSPMGEAYIADPVQLLRALASSGADGSCANHAGRAYSAAPEPRVSSDEAALHPEEVFATIRDTVPVDTAYVVESTSTNNSFWRQMDLRRGSSYFFPAAGGLGFGLPAAIGVALGLRDLGQNRRVTAIVGDGSANYAISALWSARQFDVDVNFVILRNGTYGALRWFAELLDVQGAPGMDVPGIDFTAIADGYGLNARTCHTREDLVKALANSTPGPRLVQVDTCLTRP